MTKDTFKECFNAVYDELKNDAEGYIGFNPSKINTNENVLKFTDYIFAEYKDNISITDGFSLVDVSYKGKIIEVAEYVSDEVYREVYFPDGNNFKSLLVID